MFSDDRQEYYINAFRENAKSPYTWAGTNITSDTAYWGSGQPSKKDNEKCVKVWYDPTSDDLKWTSTECMQNHYVACQGKNKLQQEYFYIYPIQYLYYFIGTVLLFLKR